MKTIFNVKTPWIPLPRDASSPQDLGRAWGQPLSAPVGSFPESGSLLNLGFSLLLKCEKDYVLLMTTQHTAQGLSPIHPLGPGRQCLGCTLQEAQRGQRGVGGDSTTAVFRNEPGELGLAEASGPGGREGEVGVLCRSCQAQRLAVV